MKKFNIRTKHSLDIYLSKARKSGFDSNDKEKNLNDYFTLINNHRNKIKIENESMVNLNRLIEKELNIPEKSIGFYKKRAKDVEFNDDNKTLKENIKDYLDYLNDRRKEARKIKDKKEKIINNFNSRNINKNKSNNNNNDNNDANNDDNNSNNTKLTMESLNNYLKYANKIGFNSGNIEKDFNNYMVYKEKLNKNFNKDLQYIALNLNTKSDLITKYLTNAKKFGFEFNTNENYYSDENDCYNYTKIENNYFLIYNNINNIKDCGKILNKDVIIKTLQDYFKFKEENRILLEKEKEENLKYNEYLANKFNIPLNSLTFYKIL